MEKSVTHKIFEKYQQRTADCCISCLNLEACLERNVTANVPEGENSRGACAIYELFLSVADDCYSSPRMPQQYMSAICHRWLFIGRSAVFFETTYGLMQQSPSEIKEKLLRALDTEYNVRIHLNYPSLWCKIKFKSES